MTGEGLGYDIGSTLFLVMFVFAATVGIGYLMFRNRKKGSVSMSVAQRGVT